MIRSDEQELTATERMVLVECCARTKAIAATKVPQKANRWARAEHDEAKRNGPEWNAVSWFGDNRTVPDRVRVKLLRALRRLEERGLVATTVGDSGRLSRVRPTAEGERVAAKLVTNGDAGQGEGEHQE